MKNIQERDKKKDLRRQYEKFSRKINRKEKDRLKKTIGEELLKRECLSDYEKYVEVVHKNSYIQTKASSFLCKEVQGFIETKEDAPYSIIVISMPPQHGKSMTITSTLPSWFLLKNKNQRVICISYGEAFAAYFGRQNREKLKEISTLFGKVLKESPTTATEFETINNGSMISRGVLSGITGRGCDLMIIDDPIKNRMEADSEVYRKRIFDEWENTFKTRLSAGAKVILIQTRWHEDDLAGRIIKSEKNVKVLNLPCEAEENDLLGRAPGEPLCPELSKDKSWLEQFKASYKTHNGSRAWNSLFQGSPTSSEGGIIKRKWWKLYDKQKGELPQPLDHLIISVDSAFKAENDSDYVAIQVWGKSAAEIYLLYALKERLDFPDTIKQLKIVISKYPNASHILIEDKANGSAIIQTLRRELNRIVGVNPNGGKLARVNAVSGIIEAGQVHLPINEPFTDDFIEECAAFPNGKHDDQVDCMSQALSRLALYSPITVKTIQKTLFGAFTLKKSNPNKII